MTSDEIRGLKKGDLIYFVKEVDRMNGTVELRVDSRRVVGVTELNVTVERVEARAYGNRRGRELVSKNRLGSYSITPAAAKEEWVAKCESEADTAERRLLRARIAVAKAAAFRFRGGPDE